MGSPSTFPADICAMCMQVIFFAKNVFVVVQSQGIQIQIQKGQAGSLPQRKYFNLSLIILSFNARLAALEVAC